MSEYNKWFKAPIKDGRHVVENDPFGGKTHSMVDEYLQAQPFYKCVKCEALCASVGEDRARMLKRIVKQVTRFKFVVEPEMWCRKCLMQAKEEAAEGGEIKGKYLDFLRELD